MHHYFQKLSIWQKGLLLAKEVHEITKNLPPAERFGLTDQMRRAAISIPSNIAEGSQRTSRKEFGHFILIAKGSLAELHTQCLLAASFGYIEEDQINHLIMIIQEIDKMLRSFYKKLTS